MNTNEKLIMRVTLVLSLLFFSFRASANFRCQEFLGNNVGVHALEAANPLDTEGGPNHDIYESDIGSYEKNFKRWFIGGIIKAIKKAESLRPQSVLEVGVGTGYSLEHYPEGVAVVAVDISKEMVKKSRERAYELGRDIEVYETSELSADDLEASADVVTSFSVITVVPDPQSFLNELAGYVKPGGHVVLIMHMKGRGLMGLVDRLVDPLTQKLFGFTLLRRITDYDLSAFDSVEVNSVSRVLFYSYNHMVVLRRKE